MAVAPAKSPDAAARPADPYRIMVADDSAVVRGLLTRALEGDPRMKVVASVADGQMAINALARHDVEVVVLDIEMPVMDGLTALPKLIEARPDIKVIVASTLTRRNAEISLRCLSLGAHDYIPKPSSARELNAAENFAHELLRKVAALGAAARGDTVQMRRPEEKAPPPATRREAKREPISLRTAPVRRPKAIAIGSSTGGPQALFTLTKAIAPGLGVPVFITQHMPPTFTAILAEHIARASGLPATEAVDGEPAKPGHLYVAPGDHHMTVRMTSTGAVIALNQDPPENYCRPSADPMLRSLADAYGADLLCVILTGMGQDGRRGGEKVIEAGGTIIAQDEASSVVWGMPGAVATAGMCTAVAPLDQLGAWVTRALAGQSR